MSSSVVECPECTTIQQLTERGSGWDLQCSSCGNWWTFHIDFNTERREDGLYHVTSVDRYYGPIECKQRRCEAQAKFKTTDRGAKRRYKCAAHAGECIIA